MFGNCSSFVCTNNCETRAKDTQGQGNNLFISFDQHDEGQENAPSHAQEESSSHAQEESASHAHNTSAEQNCGSTKQRYHSLPATSQALSGVNACSNNSSNNKTKCNQVFLQQSLEGNSRSFGSQIYSGSSQNNYQIDLPKQQRSEATSAAPSQGNVARADNLQVSGQQNGRRPLDDTLTSTAVEKIEEQSADTPMPGSNTAFCSHNPVQASTSNDAADHKATTATESRSSLQASKSKGQLSYNQKYMEILDKITLNQIKTNQYYTDVIKKYTDSQIGDALKADAHQLFKDKETNLPPNKEARSSGATGDIPQPSSAQ